MVIHPIFSQKQAKFYYEPLKQLNILWGKTGSGKSFASNLKFYKEICSGDKRKKWILSGNTTERLYDNVVSELLELDKGINELEYKTVANRQRIIVKKNGTRVKCIGANNEKAQDRIQGGNEDGWYADEVVKQPKSFVQMAMSRCRKKVVIDGTDRMVSSPIIWTLNPDSPSHFIKVDYLDKIDKLNGVEYFFSFEDNPLIYDELKKEFKGTFVEEQKAKYSGVFAIRMVDGKWATAEGVVYDRFSREYHIIDSYPIGQVKEYILGIDWGYAKDHPLAIGLFAVTDTSYYCIDEIYLEGQLIDDTLIDLMKRKGWYNLPMEEYNNIGQVLRVGEVKPTYAYADSARPDCIATFSKESGIPVIPAFKDVQDGIQLVQRKLVKVDGYYGLYFLKDKCPNHVREMELYRWDTKLSTGEGKDIPVKKDDHCPDEIRYMLFTRERGKVQQVKDFRRE
jgi:PBSX family phage terminase large subunit